MNVIAVALAGLGSFKEKDNQLWATVPRYKAQKALKILKNDFNAWRINTITAYDDGKDIWVIYHMTVSKGLVNIKVRLSRKDPEIHSIASEFPSAALYERDIHEMLGIHVVGMKDKSRLFLPESYRGKPPLLKK